MASGMLERYEITAGIPPSEDRYIVFNNYPAPRDAGPKVTNPKSKPWIAMNNKPAWLGRRK